MIKIFLKPFAALAIDWKSNDFLQARIKLTILYVLLLGAVLILFSYILHNQVEQGVSAQVKLVSEGMKSQEYTQKKSHKMLEKSEHRSRENGEEHSYESDNPYEHLGALFTQNFEHTLWRLNYIILLFGTFLAYVLAGKTLRPIEEKMQQQTQFIADAAHELHNPLSAIKAATQSTDGVSAIEMQQVLSEVEEETERLIGIADGLLTLDKIKQTDDGILFDVAEVVADVCQKIAVLAAEKNITLIKNIEYFQYIGSKKQMQQVLFNLLHNAIKFSHHHNSIHITLTPKGMLSIEDFGIGIAQADMPYIFDRFYKSDDARTFSKQSGSGLGLSIVKTIINQWGARINISSKIKQGTKVVIFLTR